MIRWYKTINKELLKMKSQSSQVIMIKNSNDKLKKINKILVIILFTDPSAPAGYDTKSIFKRNFNRFEFRVFLLLD